jgi:hypothetical protein
LLFRVVPNITAPGSVDHHWAINISAIPNYWLSVDHQVYLPVPYFRLKDPNVTWCAGSTPTSGLPRVEGGARHGLTIEADLPKAREGVVNPSRAVLSIPLVYGGGSQPKPNKKYQKMENVKKCGGNMEIVQI